MKALLPEEEYEAYLESFREKRVYGLRVNTLKISPEEFEKISPFPLEKIPWTDNGYYYDGDLKPAKHPFYFAGLYYLQEPSAMTPAAVLPIYPYDRVLDVCAAPGGKSTELAAKLKGTGLLVSNDISNSRAQALLKNMELFGVRNSLILSEDPEKLQRPFSEYFDKILIDAPCSGEGMFRKEPAVIKSWLEHGNDFYVKLQKKITKAALQMLRPGGMMVYSTCTFSPEEDENIILYMKEICPELKILDIPKRYPGFSEGMPEKAAYYDEELKKCIRIFPHKVKGEGHFVCLLQKGEGEKENASENPPAASLTKLPEEAESFLKSSGMPFFNGHFEAREERLNFVPENLPSLSGLRIMRNGLFTGEILKKRFEPSQAFCMALPKEVYPNRITLSPEDPRVLKFLKGETISAEDFETKDGYLLITVSGYPLGFGKVRNGIVKNKYLPGWRYQ